MQQLRCALDRAPERDRDRLMPQADTEDRHPVPDLANEVDAHPGILRATGSRREQDAVDAEVQRIVRGELVVASYENLGTELGEVVDEVEDEAVVVVDDQDSCHS